MLISHYEASWVYGNGPMYYPKEKLSWPLNENGKIYDKEWLRQTLKRNWMPWIEAGGDVHIGEFGCHNRTPHDVALAWLKDQFELFDENGSDLKFATMAAKPYDAELTEGENVNEGVTKLYIKADGVQTGVFNVLLTPEDKADPEIKALENWNEYDFSEKSEPEEPAVIASGWSGFTTWTLTEDGVLTFVPSGEKLENGETNLKNYWKVDGVLTLPWGAYAEMITTVVISDGIHDIGQMAFYQLPNLTTVKLGADIVEIRNYAFKNCASLTTVNLENVDFIREGAFYGCSALENISFMDGVVVEDWAFSKTPYAEMNP